MHGVRDERNSLPIIEPFPPSAIGPPSTTSRIGSLDPIQVGRVGSWAFRISHKRRSALCSDQRAVIGSLTSRR
jgi:hypothetical protein